MKNVIIVSGGMIEKDFALGFLKKDKRDNMRLIAADRGLEFFAETGLKPDVAVGDFDSLSPGGIKYLNSLTDTEIRRLKPEKDDSDTQSAVNYAIDHGSENIVILGATGNRFDHLLANLGLLVLGRRRGAEIAIVDSYNYARLIAPGTVLYKNHQFGKFVSFFPIGGDVQALTLTGFKYSLHGHRLSPADSGLTVSNEITEETARVDFVSGSLLMIMTRD